MLIGRGVAGRTKEEVPRCAGRIPLQWKIGLSPVVVRGVTVRHLGCHKNSAKEVIFYEKTVHVVFGLL